MAHLIVGTNDFLLDDRLLEHVKLVVTQKLRRNEAFLLTWSYPAEQGSGRRSVWIHEGSTLQFRFSKQRTVAVNPNWLSLLLEASHSVHGLNLDDVPEPSVSGGRDAEAERETGASRGGVGRRA